MDGKCRCMDNIFIERLWRSLKYEEVYLHAYASVAEAMAGRELVPLLQRGAAAPEPRLPHTAAGLCGGMPVDKWTIGFADRLRPPRLPEPARKAGKCSPSPTSPRAQQPTEELIKRVLKVE